MIISAFAVQSKKSYIYIRGEYNTCIKRCEAAIKEAYDAGLLGKNIMGSGFDHDMDVYVGAGAYICGEETGMISSMEGKKGQPKLKPPFPGGERLFWKAHHREQCGNFGCCDSNCERWCRCLQKAWN